MPQSSCPKDLLYLKKTSLSNSCRFQSIQIWRQWKNQSSKKKKPKINQFVIKSVSKTNCKRFRKNAIRDYSNLKTETQMSKNAFQKPRQIYRSIRKKREAVTSFLRLCLNKNWVPGQRLVGISKSSLFSGLRSPGTFFRHPQGHQRAGALTGSIKINQNTVITVYEVESQKTDKTSFENGLIHLQKTTKRQKVMLPCNAKGYQSILQNPTAKKYKRI